MKKAALRLTYDKRGSALEASDGDLPRLVPQLLVLTCGEPRSERVAHEVHKLTLRCQGLPACQDCVPTVDCLWAWPCTARAHVIIGTNKVGFPCVSPVCIAFLQTMLYTVRVIFPAGFYNNLIEAIANPFQPMQVLIGS